MEIKSLALKTDLIFSKFSGTLIERDDYLIIQTPDNPGYHWGNFLIFPNSPKKEDYERYQKLIARLGIRR